ncbi:MAG TPA: S41 family peptidase [Gemmataceae bacterium]|nr:S41 family peptidase [Gemmataceae bacterium]
MSTVTLRKRSTRSACGRQLWQPRFRVTLVSKPECPKVAPKASWLRPTLAFALIVGVFWAGIQVGRSREAISRTPPDNSAATLEPFWETWNLAEKHYVNGAQRQRLVQGAIRGLLDSLGDQGHTHHETKEEFERYVTVMNGEAHGIGVRLRLVHHLPRVLETMPGSPARAAGIQVGDVITAIDGSDTTGLPLNQVLALIRGGSAESPVRLSISRPGMESVEISLRRTKETMAPVVWQVVPDKSVMHLTIRQFDKRTHGLVRSALADARRMKVQGLVVDLRNCPGGLVDQAMAVTSEFLPDGDIAIERTAEGKQIHHQVKPGGLATAIPVCVLINSDTSSAAEVMAAAIKDHHRGTVIGSRSAGLGTMLHPYRMSDGSVVFLAIAEWITPNGDRIWHQGVAPTVQMQLPDEANALLPSATAYLDPQTFTKLEDRQLDKALTLLCGSSELVAQFGGAVLE